MADGTIAPLPRLLAERLRKDPSKWTLGFIYSCADDPRRIVRNLHTIGWTWNFAHPVVLLAIGAITFAFVGVYYLFAIRLQSLLLAGVSVTVLFVALIALAHYEASGPR